MTFEVTHKTLSDGTEYIHSKYASKIDALDVIQRLVDDLVKGSQQAITLVLSDWEDVTGVTFDPEDVLTFSSLTSVVEFNHEKVYIALYAPQDNEITQHIETFVRENLNQNIIAKRFKNKQDALIWLEGHKA
ncbi:MAG: hypothetical protein ACNI26_00595 [Terasakiella sp.]|uniref:hypothetical protein n=1 Tax=unclassified Terasakiella TaxID=2614952 RepID=UPI003B000813